LCTRPEVDGGTLVTVVIVVDEADVVDAVDDPHA
jgi:hypothetical protein